MGLARSRWMIDFHEQQKYTTGTNDPFDLLYGLANVFYMIQRIK